MSKFANSFETIYEALITRATTGCFSAGDVVTFDAKGIQKHDDYKKLTNALKSRLDDMMRTSENGESVIVVTDTTLGVLNGTKAPSPSTITIAYSQGGGRWVEPITIPGSLTEFMTAVEPGVNLVDKIPSVAKVEYPATTEAEEVDLKELEKNRTKGHASSTLHGESFNKLNTSMDSEEMELWNKYRNILSKNSGNYTNAASEEKRVFQKLAKIRTEKGNTAAKSYLKSLIKPFIKGESYTNRYVPRRSSYSDYSPSASSDLEMEVEVYLGIEDAIKGWIKSSYYEKPQMDAKQLYMQTLKQVSSIDGFGEDKQGKKCFFWKNVTTNTSDAKWYAEDNHVEEGLAEKILSPFSGVISDSFEEYLIDNLDDHVEIYGAEDWENVVREADDDWDDYQDTIADGWYNR